MNKILHKLLSWVKKREQAAHPVEKPAFYAALENSPPSPAPSMPVRTKPTMRTVKVKSGDTLFSLAQRFNTTVQAIVQANHLGNIQAQIQIGQRLLIPIPSSISQIAAPLEAPAVYHVGRGESVENIARKFNVPPETITTENNLSESDQLAGGRWLFISPAPIEIASPPVTPVAEPLPRPAQPIPLPVVPKPVPKTKPIPVAKAVPVSPKIAPQAVAAKTPTRPHPAKPSPPVEVTTPKPPVVPADAIQGVFLAQHSLNDPGSRARIFELLDKTSLNTLMIDFKTEWGHLSFPVQTEFAADSGANRLATQVLPDFLAELKANGIRTIARIAVFKDNLLAKTHPHLHSGGLGSAAGWVDPASEGVWAYNLDVATEAARLGFDEIAFDYLRFSGLHSSGYPKHEQLTGVSRSNAIAGFLSAAKGHLSPFGVQISATISRSACFRQDDALIGQSVGRMAPYLDTLCPLLLPDSKALAADAPILYRQARDAIRHLAAKIKAGGTGCQIRPWIIDEAGLSAAQIQARISGVIDGGAGGYTTWNSQTIYTKSVSSANHKWE